MKAMTAFLNAASFHEASGPSTAADCADAPVERSVIKAGSAANADTIARRLTLADEALDVIIGSFEQSETSRLTRYVSKAANQRRARRPGAKKYSPPRVTTNRGRPCSRRRIGCCGMVN